MSRHERALALRVTTETQPAPESRVIREPSHALPQVKTS